MQLASTPSLFGLCCILLVGLIGTPALAQDDELQCTKLQPCNTVSLSFDDALGGVQADMSALLGVLRTYTDLGVTVPRQASQVKLVYGIYGDNGGSGELLSGAITSKDLIMVPGEPSLIAMGEGPIGSAWDAFDDPLVGFVDPLLGFVDPLLGFDAPLEVGFVDPLLGFDNPIIALDAIWGNGNVGLEPNEFGLVLLSMSQDKGGAPVLNDAAVVTFGVTDRAASKQGMNAAAEAPTRYELNPAYPNPFNPTTLIAYEMPEAGQVTLRVFNALGQEVAVLAQGNRGAGRHEVRFDASELSAGVYLYVLEAGGYQSMRQMVLLK